MRRRDLLRLLLTAASASALLPFGARDMAAQEPAPAPAPAPEADTPPPDGPHRNNIVGLNLARLHQPLYIWAASDLVYANGGDWGYITVVWTQADRDNRDAEYNFQLFLDRCFEFHAVRGGRRRRGRGGRRQRRCPA